MFVLVPKHGADLDGVYTAGNLDGDFLFAAPFLDVDGV